VSDVEKNGGGLLAAVLMAATIAFVAIGTMWPTKAALAYTGGQSFANSPSTPEAAVENLGAEFRAAAWPKAYDGLANKAEFTEQEFEGDLKGYYSGLRSYATVDHFEVFPLHASDTDADVRLKLYWSSVVGISESTRDLHLVRSGNHWEVEWPFTKKTVVPPQVIPVNYLRWDVINRGAGDDWGAQDVEAPHVRIVDMRPVQRAEGVVVLGELLNEDVVPAYVSVNATLMGKNQQTLGMGSSFDKISHLLLPKQVTPFFIDFPNVSLADVGSVRMTPFSTLVPASADPVIEIDSEKLNPAPDASLTGQVINQSGQVVNVAHVLGTFYDSSGHVVWVADEYLDHALLPQTPESFSIHIPEDLARQISSERTIVATYSSGGQA
jgi:hypothetical protein